MTNNPLPNKRGIVLGVVIARQGSKGVPGKNLAKLGNHSLLGHSLRAALGAKTLDRVLLSTDSPAMARLGIRYGAEVPFRRPAHLASDRAHTPPVIEHAVSFLEKREGVKVGIVVTLQSTSPFRRPEHIDRAVRMLIGNPGLDSVITVKPAAFPPHWMLRGHGRRLVPLIGDGVDYSLKERQQLPSVFQPNGAVYVTRRRLLREKGVLFSAFSGGATGFVEMDPLASMDIDHPLDLVMVRAVLRQGLPGSRKRNS